MKRTGSIGTMWSKRADVDADLAQRQGPRGRWDPWADIRPSVDSLEIAPMGVWLTGTMKQIGQRRAVFGIVWHPSITRTRRCRKIIGNYKTL